MEEAIDILAGRTEGDLKTVALTLGAHILSNAGVVSTVEAGVRHLQEKIRSGEGLRKFAEMIAAQGGDPRVTEDTALLPHAPKRIELRADTDGWLGSDRDVLIVGNAAKLLGAGSRTQDGRAGFVRRTDALKKRVGDRLRRGDVIAGIACRREIRFRGRVCSLLKGAIAISDAPDPEAAAHSRGGRMKMNALCAKIGRVFKTENGALRPRRAAISGVIAYFAAFYVVLYGLAAIFGALFDRSLGN